MEEMIEFEDYIKEIDEVTIKVNKLCLQDALKVAHELFVHSSSIYLNLCHQMGGKKEWRRHFNQIMQEELDGLYTTLKGQDVNNYVNSLPYVEGDAKIREM